ncbi:hypothetical protein SPHINGO391_470076 [Sphingomonas aurantiaca]|uniref:Uncharacterized protein n=1 Tax=Sphingomonas aurantiaca TaxID=185949 RepID=A0A5E7ZMZ2_9SPHN|nr:hypothetical protein SPHINGO391_470076 [Sphingomonas aurantiaca]
MATVVCGLIRMYVKRQILARLNRPPARHAVGQFRRRRPLREQDSPEIAEVAIAYVVAQRARGDGKRRRGIIEDA